MCDWHFVIFFIRVATTYVEEIFIQEGTISPKISRQFLNLVMYKAVKKFSPVKHLNSHHCTG